MYLFFLPLVLANITIYSGDWGEWKGMVDAPNNTIACGAQLRVQKAQGPEVDDTAANGIRMVYCDERDWYKQVIQSVHEGDYGTWGRVIRCKPDQYVAGMSVRYNDRTGIDDDTAMNGLTIICRDP